VDEAFAGGPKTVVPPDRGGEAVAAAEPRIVSGHRCSGRKTGENEKSGETTV
jgi:hypothetical protein